MVNDIIEELLDLDMEPKPESLWWTRTHKHEDMRTLSVGGRDKVWDLPFSEVFEVLGHRFHREPVTCREYTLPRDEKSSDPKGWTRGNSYNLLPTR